MRLVALFIMIFLVIRVNAVDFIISEDGCNAGDGLTSESSYTTYRTTTSDYEGCTAISDRTLPRSVDYVVTINLKAYRGSTPALMFNIHDEWNYDMVYFRSENYDCLGIASVADGTFNKHTNDLNVHCDGFLMNEEKWYEVQVEVSASSFTVSIDAGFSKTYPSQISKKPSAGVLQAMTYMTQCNFDCAFDFRSLDVIPNTDRDLHATEYGTLVTPHYQPDNLYYHQLEFHQLGRTSGKYCFVALHLKTVDIGHAEIYVEYDFISQDEEGAIKFYSVFGPDLKVYFYSANMSSSYTGYIIEFHVFSCGIDKSELSFVCSPGHHDIFYEDYFRSTAFVSDPNDYKSDSGMEMGWYRFESCAGRTLETTPPASSDICGTRDPIWMQEPDGGIDKGLSEGTACVFTSGDDCVTKWKIPIHKCDNFMVYYLLPSTPTGGYCVGNRLFCDNSKNMTSVDGTGCDPCVEVHMPEMTGVPVIEEWEESDNNKGLYNLHCLIQEPHNPSQQIRYNVTWLVYDGTTRHILHTVNKTSATTVSLESSVFTHDYLQTDLVCRVCLSVQIDGHDLYGEWMESESKFIGLQFIDEEKEMVVGDDSVEIRFEFTVPFSCDGNQCMDPEDNNCFTEVYFMTAHRSLTKLACINYLYREPELLHLQGCSVTVPCSRWNKIQRHRIIAKDTTHDGLQPFSHTLYAVTKDRRQTWNNVLSKATVHIEIDQALGGQSSKFCASNNDPHLSTFKNVKYDNHLQGEFVLYKSKPEDDPGMESLITAQYKRCRTALIGLQPYIIACNVAVGIRVKNEAVIIDAQAVGAKHRYVGPGYGEQGFELLGQDNMKSYTVKLPRGETVKVTMQNAYGTKWLNINVKSLPREIQHYSLKSNGLCGKLNSNQNTGRKDMVWRDGRLYTGSTGLHHKTINAFSEDWRALDDEAIILKDTITGQNPSTPSAFSCNVHEINDFVLSVDNLNDMPVVRTEPCIPYSTPCIPDTKGACNLLEGLRNDVIAGMPKNQRTPIAITNDMHTSLEETTIDWTNETALEYCNSFIGDSSIASTCASVTPEEVDAAIKDCAADIMLTNDTMFAAGTLTALRELCTIALYNNLTLWTFDESSNGTVFHPPSELTDSLCPSDCSGHGDCMDGQCHCHGNYISYDCSMSVETPPVLTMIIDAVCNTSDGCEDIRIIGDNLVHGSGLTCHFADTESNTEEKVPGYLLSYDFVSCPIENLTLSKAGFTKHSLRISNDGVHISEQIDIVVVTVACMTCDLDSDEICILNIDECFIDNKCVSKGMTSDVDVCQYCEPALNQFQWSIDCDDGQGLNSLQIGMIVLGCTVLVAGVVIGTMYIRYRSKIRKVQPVDDIELESNTDVTEISSDKNVHT